MKSQYGLRVWCDAVEVAPVNGFRCFEPGRLRAAISIPVPVWLADLWGRLL